jgi:hypothetical protein
MKRFYILVCALLAAATLSAQESTTATTEKSATIESLNARLTKSEKRIAVLGKLEQYLKVTAFFQGQYEWHDADSNHSTSVSTFSLRRARFSLTGDLYKGKKGAKIDYRFYFDLARVPKNPLLDLWLRYQPVKEFAIQLGQFKNPFSFEASISPSKYDFVDFSYAVCNLAKMGSNDVCGLNVTARDGGVMFLGGFIHRDGYSILNYHVGVLNGNGLNEKDNNKSKDIFGRITVKPSKDLALAAYYQWGEANLVHMLNDKPELYADYRWEGDAKYVTTHRWGGGFNYDGKKGFARGEYIAGLTGAMPSEGLYVEGGKRFNLKENRGMIWAGAMVDYFCRNCFDYIHRDTRNAAIDMRYSLCLGYTPVKYFRVQLAYSLEQRIHYTFDNNRHFGNGIKLMVTGMF